MENHWEEYLDKINLGSVAEATELLYFGTHEE